MLTFFAPKSLLSKHLLLWLPLVCIISLHGWEFPTTKGRPAVIFEASPGVYLKGPETHVSVLYQASGNTLTDPFGNQRKVNDWHPAVGVRASAQIMANNKQSMEFLYYGLFNWTPVKASEATNGVGVNTAPFTTDDWASADKVEWRTHTKYNSYELAAWFHLTPRYEDYFSFSVLAGGRFFQLEDIDTFFAFSSLVEPIPTPSEMRTSSDNWIRGAEVGLEVYCRPLSYLIWALQGRGGLGADTITRSIYLTDDNNTTLIADYDEDDHTLVSAWGEFIPYVIFQNNQLYFRFTGIFTYISKYSPSDLSFNKARKITDIKSKYKYILAGGFVGVGYVF